MKKLPSHQQTPSTEQERGEAGAHAHKPLQRLELDLLQLLAQRRHLLLDLGLGLFDLELLRHGLLADAALFQVQIQAYAGLGPPYFVPQPAVELGDVVGEPLVRRPRRVGLGAVCRKQLAAQLGEIHLLGVRRLRSVLAADHGSGEVLDAAQGQHKLVQSGDGMCCSGHGGLTSLQLHH